MPENLPHSGPRFHVLLNAQKAASSQTSELREEAPFATTLTNAGCVSTWRASPTSTFKPFQ